MRGAGGLVALLLLAAACGAPGPRGGVAAAEGAAAPLTLERILAQPSLSGTSPAALAWSPDGTLLAFLWNDAARSGRDVWLVGADGAGLRRLTGGDGGAREPVWEPDGGAILFLRGGSIARADLDGEIEVLIRDVGGASDLAVAPDGRFVSFLRDGDLWLLDLGSRSLERATDVAVPAISSLRIGRYSRRDVEIGPYVWGGPTHAWAPDSRTIAVHHVDRRGVREVPFPDYLAPETEPNPVRRGYPGDPNESRTVGLLDVESRSLRLLDLERPDEYRIVDFEWSPGGRLLLDRESDTAVDRRLDIIDRATGDVREIWRHRRESRVYTLCGSAWHPDGERVVFLSDLEDRYGLYIWSDGEGAPRRITPEGYDVLSPPRVAGRAIFFEANAPLPRERHVFRIGPGGGPPERLTAGGGEHRGVPSPDGEVVALLGSDDRTPTELYLVDATESAPPRRITRSTPPDFDERPWADVRYATFPSEADGATLHARIMEPRGLDRSRRHPVLFGPIYSNTVRDRFGGRYALVQQLLVERGYIVVQVDVRGSTGYGRAFREAFLGDFAGTDLEDLASAVRHMESLPYVDPDRIGVWGSSYGGLMAVYALLKRPGLFEAGVAAAAAVDPHFFGGDDVAIVRRPDTHPEVFLRGAEQYAAHLEDPLLLIHGMQDQVVPFKTVVALAEALIREGKDFDLAIAPRGTHGWMGPRRYGRYLLGKLVDHFDRHLAPVRPVD